MTALTHKKLCELLSYDPETGIFVWKSGAFLGRIAGSRTSDGYLRIGVLRVRYKAHRLAWFYCHKSWPLHDIDHIDGVRTNNAISNLRDVKHSSNAQNKRVAQINNSTGMLGVSFSRKEKKFRARILVKGKRICLGFYPSPEDAHAAYLQAKRIHHEGCTI